MDITQDVFQKEVLEHQGLVVVDFWAPWCGPCRVLSPIIEELAEELQGKVKVAKVNVDENGEIASQYNVMGIPTIIFFKNGQMVDQHVGVLQKEDLKKKIDGLM